MAGGTLFGDLTTVSENVTFELFVAQAQMGISIIDALISGGRAGAEGITLSVMSSGDADALPALDW